MAISSYKVFLMEKDTDWKKLIDIKEYPDLGGPPESLDTTTLSDKMKTSIPGIQSVEALEFPANYTLADYKRLKAMEGSEKEYAVWLGGTETPGGEVTPTGSDGKYEFKGALSVFVKGGGVNEVVGMTVTVTPSTPITLKA